VVVLASLLHTVWDGASGALVEVAVGAVITLLSVFVVPRRLWRLNSARRPEDVTLLVSEREPELTRSYALPVVGMGQIQSIGALAPSLVRSYGWRWHGPLSIRPGLEKIEARDLVGRFQS
jgi:hypothetical protein